MASLQTFPADQTAAPLAAPSSPTGEKQDRAGCAFQGYSVLEVLGQGGMGVVYKARDLKLNRLVALKTIRTGSEAGREEVWRFQREAEAIARLQHPNVVQIYKVGEAEGCPYLTLEYLDGGSLASQLDGTPWPPVHAARFTEQLAAGVQAAHERDVVHRDLKPANIMLQTVGGGTPGLGGTARRQGPVGPDWIPKITDFGLAKLLDSDQGRTRTEAIFGTPSYMAPEQAMGRSRSAGTTADVYALGAILYELLTGRPPFKAESVLETLRQVEEQEPVPPSRIQSKIPRDLETICLKCLQKEPGKRYLTARAFAQDLRRFLNQEPIRARPTSCLVRFWRWCKRRPALAAAVVLGVVVVVSACIVPILFALNDARTTQVILAEQRQTQAALEAAQENLRRAEALEREKTEQLWKSYLDQARARRVSGLPGQRYISLSALAAAARIRPALELRNEAVSCLPLVDGLPTRTSLFSSRHRLSQFGTAVAIDPATQSRAVAQGSQVLVFSGDGQERRRLSPPSPAESVYYRTDGRLLVVACRNHNVYVYRMPEGRLQSVLEGHQSGITGLVFSETGGMLASSSFDGTTRIWDPIDGRCLLLHGLESPSTEQVALSGLEGGTVFADGKECRVVHHGTVGRGGDRSTHKRGVWDVGYSPDGCLLATGAEDGVRVWDTNTWQELALLETDYSHVCFGPSGDLWVGAGGQAPERVMRWPLRRSSAQDWQFGPARSVDLQQVHNGGPIVRFAPDGKTVVASQRGGQVHFLDAGTLAVLRTVHQPPQCCCAEFSPEGRYLATASWAWSPPQPINVWDPGSGRLVHQLRDYGFARCAFAPDGRTLIICSTAGYSLLDVSTWTARFCLPYQSHLPGWAAYAPDGQLLAVTATNYLVKLVNPSDGSEICTLTPPTPGLVSGLQFSPDGTQLCVLTEANRFYIWDLRLVRAGLAMMGLDWDLPPYPTPTGRPSPLRITIAKH